MFSTISTIFASKSGLDMLMYLSIPLCKDVLNFLLAEKFDSSTLGLSESEKISDGDVGS